MKIIAGFIVGWNLALFTASCLVPSGRTAQTNLPPGAIRMVLHGDHCALLINDKSDRVIYVDVEAKKPVMVTEKANPVISDGMVHWNGGWVKEIATADGKGLWTGELLPKDRPKTKLDLVGR